ncbi:MAG: hypothetical protein PWQ96_265 [Clostridia bacterium]|jgi:glycosyltransferase involved in cell wall biosynthesis|nr:hypothetical protein [Clostridia bacterium]
MPKINVMHIVRPAAGGMKGHVLSLLEHIDRKRFNPILVCPEQVISAKDPSVNYKVLNLEIAGEITPRHDWRVFKCLLNMLNSNDIHIVHTHGAKAGLLGRLAAWKTGVPIIINTVHNFIYDTPSIYLKYPLILLHRRLNKFTDMQITVSQALQKSVSRIEKCNEKKICTIYNGIDLNNFNLLLDCNEIKKQLNLDLKSPVVGVISRLIPQKGVHLFLKAAKIILDKLPDTKFLVAGEGPQRPSLEKMAYGLGLADKVIFLGYVPNVPALLPLINVFLIPSLSEGLSIGAIEAMAARRPIVAFAVGGLPEVIENCKTGFLVQKGDYISLAEKTVNLINNRKIAEKFGVAARQVVEEKFTLSVMVAETERLYNELLHNKGIKVSSETVTSEAVLK